MISPWLPPFVFPDLAELIARDERARPEKLPPMNCKRCNHRNEYVGEEHLIGGVYVCRQCRGPK